MNLWKIELSRKAARDFRRLDRRGRESAVEVIEDLEETGPAIHGAIELRNNPGLWRVRFDDDRYRMVYHVSRTRKLIVITRMKLRAIVYSGLRD